jgi:hypothetical protein
MILSMGRILFAADSSNLRGFGLYGIEKGATEHLFKSEKCKFTYYSHQKLQTC